jgi:uncharacterized protein YjbJ (UPF0337 family)
MDANQDSLQDKWPTLKGQVKQRWGKLTADDIARLSGHPAELSGLLRQRYGYGQAQAELEIDHWVKAAEKKSQAAA